MSKESIAELRKKMGTAFEVVSKEFAGLRTGRASPSLLESIIVEAYGNKMPINQLGSISVPEPRLLTVSVWDAELAPLVEKAIRESDLGLNPSSAGAVIRVPLPNLSEERRRELAKIASKYAEQGRVAVRNIRRDAIDQAKKMEKEGHVSEDETHRLTEEIQDVTDEFVKKIDETLAHKEKEIMQV